MFCPLIAAVKTGISPGSQQRSAPYAAAQQTRPNSGYSGWVRTGPGGSVNTLQNQCSARAYPTPTSKLHSFGSSRGRTPPPPPTTTTHPPIRPTTPTADLLRGHHHQRLPNHQPQSAHPPCLPAGRLGLSERSSFTSQRVRGH